MVCCSLRHRGAELLDRGQGVEAYAQRGKTMGIPLLYPWANRLAGPSLPRRRDHGAPAPRPRATTRPTPTACRSTGRCPGTCAGTLQTGSPAERLTARLAWNEPELLELFPFEHELVIEADGGQRRPDV